MEQNEYATIRINGQLYKTKEWWWVGNNFWYESSDGQVCLEADFVRLNVTFEEKRDYVIASRIPMDFYLRCSG